MNTQPIHEYSPATIADCLAKYQQWRRGEPPYDYGVPTEMPFFPTDFGKIIDRAIEILKGIKQ